MKAQEILETPLGRMVAIADNKALYFLNFIDLNLEHEIKRLERKVKTTITPGSTEPIDSIKAELDQFFEGTLKEFKTPMCLVGTPFQISVWEELQKIPFGETRSYLDIATAIGKPTAYRAVAQANGANLIPIVIPCHRVVNHNGDLGGYSAGLGRKKWLLNHEKNRG